MSSTIEVKVKKLAHFDPAWDLPHYATFFAAGADIRAALSQQGSELVIPVGKRLAIPTGLSFEIPAGFEIQVRPRSGLSLKTGLMVVNSPGTIDSDYRGELMILLGNLGHKEEVIKHGDRIAQLVLAPVVQAKYVSSDELTTTQRGAGGFGSTGMD